jgi:hypothetical protein
MINHTLTLRYFSIILAAITFLPYSHFRQLPLRQTNLRIKKFLSTVIPAALHEEVQRTRPKIPHYLDLASKQGNRSAMENLDILKQLLSKSGQASSPK